MSTIFLDLSAVTSRDAAARLTHLVDAGHELVLVGEDDHRTDLPLANRVRSLPSEPPMGSWFVTADPATCGDRRPSLRTVMIGPRTATPGPTRCDSTARDLRAAVLEILAAHAMS